MTVACVTVLCVSVSGCMLTAITAAGVGGVLIAIVVILAVLLPLPVYWHEKGKEDRREAMLVLLWTVVLAAILRYPLLIGARLRMPLRDVGACRPRSLPRGQCSCGDGMGGPLRLGRDLAQ